MAPPLQGTPGNGFAPTFLPTSPFGQEIDPQILYPPVPQNNRLADRARLESEIAAAAAPGSGFTHTSDTLYGGVPVDTYEQKGPDGQDITYKRYSGGQSLYRSQTDPNGGLHIISLGTNPNGSGYDDHLDTKTDGTSISNHTGYAPGGVPDTGTLDTAIPGKAPTEAVTNYATGVTTVGSPPQEQQR